jgi:hypothetical protein
VGYKHLTFIYLTEYLYSFPIISPISQLRVFQQRAIALAEYIKSGSSLQGISASQKSIGTDSCAIRYPHSLAKLVCLILYYL